MVIPVMAGNFMEVRLTTALQKRAGAGAMILLRCNVEIEAPLALQAMSLVP